MDEHDHDPTDPGEQLPTANGGAAAPGAQWEEEWEEDGDEPIADWDADDYLDDDPLEYEPHAARLVGHMGPIALDDGADDATDDGQAVLTPVVQARVARLRLQYHCDPCQELVRLAADAEHHAYNGDGARREGAEQMLRYWVGVIDPTGQLTGLTHVLEMLGRNAMRRQLGLRVRPRVAGV